MASIDGSLDIVSAPPSDVTRASDSTARFGGASSEEAALVSIIAADAVASPVVGRRGEALNSPTDPDARAGESRQCEGSVSGHPFPFVRMPPPQASAVSPTRRARTISPQGRTAPLASDDPVGKRGRTETIISDEPDSDNGSPLGQSGNPGNLGGYPGSRSNRGRATGSSPRGVRRAKKDS